MSNFVEPGSVAAVPPVVFNRRALWPFLLAGALCVIGGGLFAAATAYVTTQKTAWATAYLVLVGGVAQIGWGAALGWLAPRVRQRWVWLAFAGWNLGNAGVLTGQLTGVLILTDAGTVLLVASLVVVLVGVSRFGRGTDAPPPHPAALHAFRALVVLLAVSMPVGVILAHLGA